MFLEYASANHVNFIQTAEIEAKAKSAKKYSKIIPS